ncbi:MAG: haloacid dehalogenase [Cereibacter sphaeroides]|uniref:phosphoglycolate phosphatase n=1 Tax=Cereibacter sphaeroides TaxID=1063 RepID=A0A2W5SF65_CERSP|nr:MAG: haloacid dehalogenase [Cereibacter sphaeroides]
MRTPFLLSAPVLTGVVGAASARTITIPFARFQGLILRTVVFDLDGTLADTSADLIAAANACFRALGHGDMLDQTDALTAFQGGRAMLRLGLQRLDLLNEAEVDRQYPHLLSAYADAIDTHTRLYPGAAEAVERLRAEGYATAICTNKPEALAETLMQRLGVRNLFGSLVGADTLPVRKPDPAPLNLALSRVGGRADRAILIGDTDTDRLTGRNAGVPVALVTFGPEGHEVARMKPEALLDHFDDLSALVAQIIR